MKGNISLNDFIKQVKQELIEAEPDNDADAHFALDKVDLEISFVLDIEGGAKAKLLVLDIDAKANAAQTHKVTLRLTPLPKNKPEELEALSLLTTAEVRKLIEDNIRRKHDRPPPDPSPS